MADLLQLITLMEDQVEPNGSVVEPQPCPALVTFINMNG